MRVLVTSIIIAISGACSVKDGIPRDVLIQVVEDFHLRENYNGRQKSIEVVIKHYNAEFYTLYITKRSDPYLESSSYIPYDTYEKEGVLYCFIDLINKPSNKVLNNLMAYNLLQKDSKERDLKKIFSDTTNEFSNSVRLDLHGEIYYYFVCTSDTDIMEKRKSSYLLPLEELPEHLTLCK